MTIKSYSDVKKIIGVEMKKYKDAHPNCKMGEPMKHAYQTQAVKKAMEEYKALPKDKRVKTSRKKKSQKK